MRRFFTPLLASTVVSEAYTELKFSWPNDLRRPLPGQFLSLGINSQPEVFLRRPFSLSGWDEAKRHVRILVQARGPASEALCRMRPGEELDVLGPRGFPFPYTHSGPKQAAYLLVGGGIGIGPLLFAAQYLREKGEHVILCLGFREPWMIPLLSFPRDIVVHLSCEFGPLSPQIHQGKVLELVKQVFHDVPIQEIWGCGPPGMLKALATMSQQNQLSCYVLMEEMMACAVGACMGCAVAVRDEREYLRACTEGPVFDASLVDWEKLWI